MLYKDSPEQQFQQLEIGILRDATSGYIAELRVPDGSRVSCRIGEVPEELKNPGPDPTRYGVQLFTWLFANEIGPVFYEVQQLATEADPDNRTDLRIRLWLDPKEEVLSTLRWEALCRSPQDQPLSVSTAFSRFLRDTTPRGWPVWERPIRVLLIVSNPRGLSNFDLTAVDQSLERSLIQGATRQLGSFLNLERLTNPTVQRIQEKERENFHITHLLAHAVMRDGQGYVILPDVDGNAQEARCEDVANAITTRETKTPPYLVFLATPLQAQEQNGKVLIRLASLLIRAGVQAVVAIQAPIEPELLRRFTERFYEVLIRTGTIDVAMAEARESIFNPTSWQWTYPVLFTRTEDTQIYQNLPDVLESKLARLALTK